ncbi:hypothetical protein SM18210_22600, partial [Xanthomonas hortorum pv. gardneri]
MKSNIQDSTRSLGCAATAGADDE